MVIWKARCQLWLSSAASPSHALCLSLPLMTGAIAAHTLQTDQASIAWKLHLKEYTFLAAPSLSRYLVSMSLLVSFSPVVLLFQFVFVFSCCLCCPPLCLSLPVCIAQYTILGELCLVKMLVWQNPVASQGCMSADCRTALGCPIYSQRMNCCRTSVVHTSLMCCRTLNA